MGWGDLNSSAASPWGWVQIWGARGVPWAVPSADGFKSSLWFAVQTNTPAGRCCISIPQTAALLDYIPSTNYFMIFFNYFFHLWFTKSSPGGARIPLQGEFKITDSHFNFLRRFFFPRVTRGQADPVSTEQTGAAALETPANTWGCHQAPAAAGTQLENPEQAELLPQAGDGKRSKRSRAAPPSPCGKEFLGSSALLCLSFPTFGWGFVMLK